MDKITCYIRRNKEWAEKYQFGKEQLDLWNIGEISKVWDETFTISYKNFRRMLNQIQQENFKEVPFDAVINQYEYKHNEYYGIVVPTDDDDWFHPEIVPTLKSVQKPKVFWNFINYTEGVVSVQQSLYERVQYESNNYAMTRSDQILFDYHAKTNELYRNKDGFHIDISLSMHNRSMASLGLLHQYLSDIKGGILHQYDISRQPVKMVGDVPQYFMKYVDKMLNIYRNVLKVRRIFI